MVLSRSSSTSYLRLCILSALGVLAVSATAATNDSNVVSDDELPEVELDKIVVTATRTPTKTSNVIAQTRVVDKEDLKRFQGQTVMEVLRRQPGFSIKQDGGLGQSSNFYLRGYDSKRVLVLIDGVRYGSMTSGQPALNLLPADQVDRIEVLYGASGSSIYGADAMGGVIQIFTRGSGAEQTNFSVTAGVGSNDHYVYGAAAQFANAQGAKLSLSANRNQTKGISALEYQTGNNKDDDGFKSNNFSLNASIPLTQNISVGATGIFAKSTTEFDDFGDSANAEIDQENGAVSAFSQYENDKLTLRLSAGQSLDKLDNKVGDAFETKQKQANLISTYQLPVGQIQAGAEWLKQEVDLTDNTPDNGSDSYKINDRTIKSGFAGYQVNEQAYDFQANVRYDDNSQFGDETTFGLGYAVKLAPSLRLGTSFATGYRAPTLNDLYIESSYYIPNEDLKVEKSKNLEIFIESTSAIQTTRLTGFNSDVKNLITNKELPSYKYQASNIDEARLSGYSFTSDWQLSNILFGGQYTRTNAESRSGDDKGKQLVFRPEHTGLVYVGYQAANFDIRTEAEYVGKTYNVTDNSTFMNDYTLFNISGSYYLSPNLTWTSRINNLTNVDYSTNESFGEYGSRYNQDGTNFFTSLTYNWF
ncbi:TonB-dependent receptor domain-containing protein [Psychrobacter sp. LV10R520-6]|uniref:TonB-dependent receptor domain-containing protein n=1 Tax=Psychrobacter sp. LV10R520-6 TaxID=1415574 RepID=UPI0024CD7D83|nr:TonB-dependent receptor [Psychrobacter sp. LV10R520-6]SNT69755.1 vitamin B12 transporter [Psychrobacter sp. LV10R520-6]